MLVTERTSDDWYVACSLYFTWGVDLPPLFFSNGNMISQLLFRDSLATYRFPLLLDKFFSDLELTYTPLIDRWTGELNGRKGLFPASYVEQL